MISDLKNNKIMQSFSLRNIPELDVCVLGALELLYKEKIPEIKIPYKRPLVVGSGNALATGQILFHDKDAVFASESSYKDKLNNIKNIDGVVLISASGGKHAPIIADCSRKFKKHVTLMTAKTDSEAEKFLDNKHEYDEFIFPKQKEPYTYNTSTYLGMILGKTNENPEDIYEFIENKINRLKMPDFKKYDKYFLILPSEFELLKRMFQIKFIELFGRRIARDVETFEYMKHATTIVPSHELFISFGKENKIYGDKNNRLFIPLPKNCDYGCLMAIGYYIIGRIQKSHKNWFKENIEDYVKEASRIFNEEIKVIVD